MQRRPRLRPMPFDPSSWDLGPAHIISFSTEVYFFLNYGRHLVERQFHWLESDLQVTWLEVPSHPLTSLPSPPLSLPLTLGPSLQKANKNRAARPWIITMGHRPMYCSNADLDDCTWHESKVGTPSPGAGCRAPRGGPARFTTHLLCRPAQVRKGLLGKLYGLEDLFYKHGE